MVFTEKDIEKLATLVRIKLTEEEKKRFKEQISSILDYVKQIQEVDTGKVKDVSHLPDLKNVFRKDSKTEFKDAKKIIEQFPAKHGNLNKVKPVLE